jgi:hypothetical protein
MDRHPFRSAASILTTRAIALLRADTRAFALRVTSSAGTRREFGEMEGAVSSLAGTCFCCATSIGVLLRSSLAP